MIPALMPATQATPPLALTDSQFQTLAEIPPKFEWLANLTNANTCYAYRQDVKDFQALAELGRPEDCCVVTRAHVIAWREHLMRQGLSNDTIRHKLAALSSSYAYLCDRHVVWHNPVLAEFLLSVPFKRENLMISGLITVFLRRVFGVHEVHIQASRPAGAARGMKTTRSFQEKRGAGWKCGQEELLIPFMDMFHSPVWSASSLISR